MGLIGGTWCSPPERWAWRIILIPDTIGSKLPSIVSSWAKTSLKSHPSTEIHPHGTDYPQVPFAVKNQREINIQFKKYNTCLSFSLIRQLYSWDTSKATPCILLSVVCCWSVFWGVINFCQLFIPRELERKIGPSFWENPWLCPSFLHCRKVRNKNIVGKCISG